MILYISLQKCYSDPSLSSTDFKTLIIYLLSNFLMFPNKWFEMLDIFQSTDTKLALNIIVFFCFFLKSFFELEDNRFQINWFQGEEVIS